VRSVALSPQQQPQYLLTVSNPLLPYEITSSFRPSTSQGGNEKKIRLFDLGRPDAQPLVLGNYADGNSCRGTVRSLVWDEGQGGVVGISASEDGLVRWWDLRTLEQTSSFDMGEPVNAMEMVHGGGTLSVTSGKTVHFLDIMG
jgi:serine-threonine kinase receptor-associated protein